MEKDTYRIVTDGDDSMFVTPLDDGDTYLSVIKDANGLSVEIRMTAATVERLIDVLQSSQG